MAARTIPRLPATEPPDTLYAALAKAGCLVVTDALPEQGVEIRRWHRFLGGVRQGR